MKAHRRSGFTLVEALVAAVILAAGMVAVLRAFGAAANALDAAGEVLAVSGRMEDQLAGQELEAWPARDAVPAGGGRWSTEAGAVDWRMRGDVRMAVTNAVLTRVVVEAVPARKSGVPYVMATEWLGWRQANP